jgi:hypothetical protein
MEQVEVQRTPAPTGARFVLLSNLPAVGVTNAAELVTWRLIAGNNRSLGRAAGMFGSTVDCIADADRLHREIGQAVGSIEFHSTSPTGGSFWSWAAVVDGEPVATSTHNYQRRLECLRAQANFFAAAQIALPPRLPARKLGRRLGQYTR